jgi:hypothetical protein
MDLVWDEETRIRYILLVIIGGTCIYGLEAMVFWILSNSDPSWILMCRLEMRIEWTLDSLAMVSC